jgi:hypothetical protein
MKTMQMNGIGKTKALGIIMILMIIGLLVTGCKNPSGGGGGT